MQPNFQNRFFLNLDVIQALAKVRQDWEQSVDGATLVSTNGSVGLLLADFAAALQLTPEEQSLALGDELTQQVQVFIGSSGEVIY